MQLLRVAIQLSIGPLQLPVYNGLARVFACSSGGTWGRSGLTCFGSQHAVLLVVGAVLLALFWAVTFVGTPNN
jgi:hypothetical protein